MSVENHGKPRSPKRIENLSDTLSQRSFFKFILGHADMSLSGKPSRSSLPDHNLGAAPPSPKPPVDDSAAMLAQRIDALLADVELDKTLEVAKTAGQQVVLREVIVEQPPRHLLTV